MHASLPIPTTFSSSKRASSKLLVSRVDPDCCNFSLCLTGFFVTADLRTLLCTLITNWCCQVTRSSHFSCIFLLSSTQLRPPTTSYIRFPWHPKHPSRNPWVSGVSAHTPWKPAPLQWPFHEPPPLQSITSPRSHVVLPLPKIFPYLVETPSIPSTTCSDSTDIPSSENPTLGSHGSFARPPELLHEETLDPVYFEFLVLGCALLRKPVVHLLAVLHCHMMTRVPIQALASCSAIFSDVVLRKQVGPWLSSPQTRSKPRLTTRMCSPNA